MNGSRRQFLCAAVGTGTALVSRQGGAAGAGFAKARGKDIVGPDGKPLALRGINLGNWMEPEGYMFLFKGGPQSPREIEAFFNELIGPAQAADFWREYRRRYITERDIQFIRDAGLNSVRIPLHYKFFVDGGDGFALLDPVVGWCRKAGLWAVLDMHCAPGGQTGTNIDDSWGYPWLYESERDQQLLCDVWRGIAEHYRDETAVLGYDLLNEPVPHYPRLQQYKAKLEPLYRRVTKAIREVDRNHAIVLEAAHWDTDYSMFGPPFDNNVIYEVHKYWMAPEQKSLDEYVAFRERYNVPLWLGESGENKDEWVATFRTLLEKNDIGWCFWPYKKMDSGSCMVSVARPAYWDEMTAFARMPVGTGNAEKRIAARPDMGHCRESMRGLLQNIELDACRVNDGYVRALGLKAG